MINWIFIILHLVALFAMWQALFVTIPLHIICAVVSSRSPSGDSVPAQEVAVLVGKDSKQCPFCAEEIKREAALCRYCGKDQPPIGTLCPECNTNGVYTDIYSNPFCPRCKKNVKP